MSLTICIVVVVFNTHTEFQKIKSTSPSILTITIFLSMEGEVDLIFRNSL